MTYTNTYGRFSVLDNLCGFSFAYTDAAGFPIPALPMLATIFGTGNGVPPNSGINIVNNNNPHGVWRSEARPNFSVAVDQPP